MPAMGCTVLKIAKILEIPLPEGDLQPTFANFIVTGFGLLLSIHISIL